MGREGDLGTRRWGDEEMGRLGDEEMGRLGDEEMGRRGGWGRGDWEIGGRGGWGRGDWEIGRLGDEETWGKGNSDGVLNSVRVLELFFCIEVLYSYYGGGIPFFVEGFGFSAFFVGETYE